PLPSILTHQLASSHLSALTPTPTPITHTLSLHDALPIFQIQSRRPFSPASKRSSDQIVRRSADDQAPRPLPQLRKFPGHEMKERSEEHTSELQSRGHLVCRLLLEKKKRTSKSRKPQIDLS